MRKRGSPIICLSAIIAAVILGGCGGSTEDTPEASAFVYTALGASDAVGIGAFPLDNGYVFLIAANMRQSDPDLQFYDLGISGAMADDFIDREVPQAIADNPDFATVWTGSNDISSGKDPALFEMQLRVILTELRTKTHAKVFVGNLTDLTRAPVFQRKPNPYVTPERVNDYNRRIAAAVTDTGCVLVRLSDVPLTPDVFAIDGFHPNNKGYQLLADAFWQQMAPYITGQN